MSATNGKAKVRLTPDQRLAINKRMEAVANRVAEAIMSTNARTLFSRQQDNKLDERRDYDTEFGWPTTENLTGWGTDSLYRKLYDRNPIAARVVEVLPDECWKDTPEVFESPDPCKCTDFERAFNQMCECLGGESWYRDGESNPLWNYLHRADVQCGIGHFGIVLLGINDGKTLDQPAEGIDACGMKVKTKQSSVGYNPGKKDKAKKNKRRLQFLRVFDEALVQISQWESDLKNPRYGLPTQYNVTFNDLTNTVQTGIGAPTQTANVHWTRIIHIADNLASNEAMGVPRMRPVLNNLLDLVKIYGGSSEAFWQAVAPAISFETLAQLGPDVEVDADEIEQQYFNFTNHLQRALVLKGMTAKPITAPITSPEAHINVHLQAISIELNMPQRILMGSERGELSSGQDANEWNLRLMGRRKNFVSPRIIVPIVNRLIALDVLPPPDNAFMTKWPDPGLAPQDKATIAGLETTALAAYVSGGVNALVPEQHFLTDVMGWDEERVKTTLKDASTAIDEGGMGEADNPLAQKGTLDAEKQAEQLEAQQEHDMKLADKKGTVLPPGIGGAPGQPPGGKPGFPPQGAPKKGPPIANHVVKLKDGKYRLLSHEGKNLGTFDSEEEAWKHEKEVEYFKHANNAESDHKYLKRVAASLMKDKSSPDYGQLFRNKAGDIWYVSADGDSREDTAWIRTKLEQMASRVRIESEIFPPKDEDWLQIWPELNQNEYDPNQLRDETGKWSHGGGGGAVGLEKGDGLGQDEHGEFEYEDTAYPTEPDYARVGPSRVYKPDVTYDGDGDGVADHARVGVPAHEVPPPPGIPALPNLTEAEREVEQSFAKQYEANPQAMADSFREGVVARANGGAPTFGTDDAKELSNKWSSDQLSLQERSMNRAEYNLALHQTANAIAKKAFVDHLDTLTPGDEIMVTVGGCGAGKGYAIKNVPQALAIKENCKAVWDSAGDQNATENPWIQKMAEDRGLKVNYVYVHADPETQWAHPERGVVKRAQDPNDGRMVDAKVFADSYGLGARNHAAFAEANKDNPNAKFTYVANGAKPTLLDGIPESALNIDRAQLAQFAMKTVKESGAPPHIVRGATLGSRVWKNDLAPTANMEAGFDRVVINMDPFDLEWQAQVEEERAESDWLGRWLQQNDRTVNTGPLQPMPLNQDGTEIKPTNNFEFASDEQRMAFFAGLKSGTIKVGDDRPPKGVTEYRKGNPKDETVRKTRMAYNKVMKQVTPKAREIIQRNQRSLVHHESLDELTKSFVDITGQALPAGQKVGGYYHPRQGSVNLDGPARGGRLKDDYKYERNQDSQTHMMAHELAHAVDHGGSLSQQEEWNEAWRSEIKRSDAPITNYATTHPAEGFAEFFRIATIYGSEDVKDKFPKCYEFMKKRGLLE